MKLNYKTEAVLAINAPSNYLNNARYWRIAK